MNVDGMRFRALTTTAEEHEADCANRPKKRKYSETFNQSPFTAPCQLLPEKNSRGNFKHDSSGKYVYKKQVTDETVPNLEYLFENGIGSDSHPVERFNLFPPLKRFKDIHTKAVTMDDMTSWLNEKAMISNSGKRVGKYDNFTNFTKCELMSHLSLFCCMLSRLPLDLTCNLKETLRIW